MNNGWNLPNVIHRITSYIDLKINFVIMSTKLIRLHEETIRKLSKYGKFGQSWNTVIEELLEERKNE